MDTEEAEALIESFNKSFANIKHEVRKVIVGQEEVVDNLLMTLLVGGHCLITGMPGTAKTLLVRTLSDALGLKFKRIQFTPDLMPTDVTGTDIIEEDGTTGKRTWTFVPGPLFTNVLLADEINRTPPKTQSALLEAMQEYSVTVRGKYHQIERPFFVLATQNPIESEVVKRFTTRMDIPPVDPCTTPEEILKYQALVRQVPISESVNRYAVNLIRATRPEDPSAPEVVKKYIQYGASVRATMFVTLAAKARAMMEGRYHVTREDIKTLALPVLRHRVLTNYFAESDGISVDQVLTRMIEALDKGGVQARAS
jgi:MoxR-like ATPase